LERKINMKKFLYVFLSLAMLLMLAACSGAPEVNTPDKSDSPATSSAVKKPDSAVADVPDPQTPPTANTTAPVGSESPEGQDPAGSGEQPESGKGLNEVQQALQDEAAIPKDADIGKPVETENSTPVDHPEEQYASNDEQKDVPEKQIITRHEDGKSYDQNGNRVMVPGDVDYVPTKDEEEAARELMLEDIRSLMEQGLNIYDYGYNYRAHDTGRILTSEEYWSFVQSGKDPITEDYLDSEHEQGLY